MQSVLIENGYLHHKCHGCTYHAFPVKVGVKEDKSWEWNGDIDSPTVSPSVRHFYPESFYQKHPNIKQFCCHYFIRNGMIEYCGDCTHEHAGKTLPLEKFTDTEVKLSEMNLKA